MSSRLTEALGPVLMPKTMEVLPSKKFKAVDANLLNKAFVECNMYGAQLWT